jgi:hypothetical protein
MGMNIGSEVKQLSESTPGLRNATIPPHELIIEKIYFSITTVAVARAPQPDGPPGVLLT